MQICDVTRTTNGGLKVHLYDSERVQVRGGHNHQSCVHPQFGGIDIWGCTDVVINDCIVKTSNEAICLKTMVDTKECKRGMLTNCTIKCSCVA